ncbi:MAG TPA: mechanosensitive ion channel family protein [Pirellulales bacterium]|nr:mechanosensitive ion channel family protein [Pirellulales bacterium]
MLDWRELSESVSESELLQWLLAAGTFIVAFVLLRLVVGFARRRAASLTQRRDWDVVHSVSALAHGTKWWFLLAISFYLSSFVLDFPRGEPTRLATSIVVIGLLLQIAVWADVLIVLLIERYMRRRLETDAASVTMMSALGFLGRMAAWTIAVLLILENQQVRINSLVAGLGIGGIAVALAAQNVLGDLFASLSIVLDRPFILGDFIAVDDFLGSVERIGLKTTRLRSLSGEQLVFSNNDLLKGRIRNYKRMYERRILFSLGVEYGTSHERLAAMPGMIREAILAQAQTRFDRAHFKSFGDSALLFEAVYYVLSPDYNLYMDIQQAINLALVKRFSEEGIQFAFPTQTLYVHKADGDNGGSKAATQ